MPAGSGVWTRRAKARRRIGGVLRLEGDGPGGDAAVEFRQRDLHREIGRRQAARRGCPGLPRAADGDRLQDRAVGLVEDEAVVVAGREGGGRDDRRRVGGRGWRGARRRPPPGPSGSRPRGRASAIPRSQRRRRAPRPRRVSPARIAER